MLTPNVSSDKIAEFLYDGTEAAPWLAQTCPLVSWWDVEKFAAERFYMLGLLLAGLDSALERQNQESPNSVLGLNRKNKLIQRIDIVQRECLRLSLVHSYDAAQEFKEQLGWKTREWKASEARTEFDHISGSIRREMKRTLFLYIPTKAAEYFLEPLKEWEVVIERFGKDVIDDIEEGAKCFACDRYDASVFHMMRVAEIGALEVGKLLQINDPKPGWASVSKELKRITSAKFSELNPVEHKHFALLEQISPLMLAIQNAWRHKVSHVANRLVLNGRGFQPSVAEEIMINTRAFMRWLATELP